MVVEDDDRGWDGEAEADEVVNQRWNCCGIVCVCDCVWIWGCEDALRS